MMQCCIPIDGKIVVKERPIPKVEGRNILIRVHVTALNRADIMQRLGKYPPPPGSTDVLGLECAGEVVALGDNCSRGFKIGDYVMALCEGGSYAEYCVVLETQVILKPPFMTMRVAAALPETWITSYQLLHKIAEISKTDSLLIHAGASGVGCATIQLAKRFGIQNIIVTAGSMEKIDHCKSLGAHHGFNYKTEDWVEGVLNVTGGKGCNVILDCIGYPYAESNAKAIAMDGKWVLYGLMGGDTNSGYPLLRHVLSKRLQIRGTTLRSRSPEYKEQLAGDISKLFDDFAAGSLQVIMDSRQFYGLDQANEAHTYLESNSSIGKVTLSVIEAKL